MIEIVGGVMIVLGLFTRPVAFILAGDMAVAYFIAHAPRGFFPLLNAGELAIIYCFVFLYLAVAGGGVWSLDHLRAGNKASRPAWRTPAPGRRRVVRCRPSRPRASPCCRAPANGQHLVGLLPFFPKRAPTLSERYYL